MAQLFTDDFNRADSTDLGASWATQAGFNCQIVSNKVQATVKGSGNSEVYSYAVSRDQYAEIALATINATAVTGGVFIRSGAIGAQTYYVGTATKIGGVTTTEIKKSVAAVETVLATTTATAWVANDVLRLQAMGSRLSLLQNGVVILIADDFALVEGSVGIFLYVDASAAFSDVELDNFAGGNMEGSFVINNLRPRAFAPGLAR